MTLIRNCTAAMLIALMMAAATAQQTPGTAAGVEVMIPAYGFNLAATLTIPRTVSAGVRLPAVILVPGSGQVDRDETIGGIPIFAQLAAALAEQGYLVVRYDKRGVGKSGGRDERATIEDFAEDVRSAFKWLKKRKDVDKKRITVVGHGEGGAVAMVAAAREEDVAALVLMAAPGVKGADLILEQQRHLLDVMKVTDPERKAKIDLQQKIQAAVMTGAGWEGIPGDVRRQADTPWFRSLLEFDPAKWMRRIRQPLLILQGDLDTRVRPYNANNLAQLAQQRKRKTAVELVHLPGVNHLLVRATTGEVSEYPHLKDKTIVADVPRRIAGFLRPSPKAKP